jgi:hypothetical protein
MPKQDFGQPDDDISAGEAGNLLRAKRPACGAFPANGVTIITVQVTAEMTANHAYVALPHSRNFACDQTLPS